MTQSDLYNKPNEKESLHLPTFLSFPDFHEDSSEKRLLVNAKDKSSQERFPPLNGGKDNKNFYNLVIIGYEKY